MNITSQLILLCIALAIAMLGMVLVATWCDLKYEYGKALINGNNRLEAVKIAWDSLWR
jgi:hypothetical protein